MKKVRVIVRVRPFLPKENKTERCVFINTDQHTVELVRPGDTLRFSFDSCYDTESTQESLFSDQIDSNINSLLKGVNTTVFCYGMTGAGKTHTMQGTDENPGIIPRSISTLFERIQQEGGSCNVHMSYFEIYNNKVYDLLKLSEKDLPIREDSNKNIFIPNLQEVTVQSLHDFTKTYKAACKNRKVGSTALNPESSRSHAILRVMVQSVQEKRKLNAKLHLIDLAGSEDNRQTNNTGMRMVESSSINSSLFVLGKVVEALNKGQPRIPYRDSKLTRLLQDSLGGNAQGVIIANVAPGRGHWINTQQTLNFASKSRLVINIPTVNEQVEIPTKIQNMDSDTLTHKKRPSSYFQQPTKQVVKNKNLPKQTPKILRPTDPKMQAVIEDILDYKKEMDKIKNETILQMQHRLAELETYVREEKEDKEEEDNTFVQRIAQMSPRTKLKAAKSCILKAKQVKDIDLARALKFYKKASEFLPENEKLAIKVKKLTQKVREEHDGNDDDDNDDDQQEEEYYSSSQSESEVEYKEYSGSKRYIQKEIELRKKNDNLKSTRIDEDEEANKGKSQLKKNDDMRNKGEHKDESKTKFEKRNRNNVQDSDGEVDEDGDYQQENEGSKVKLIFNGDGDDEDADDDEVDFKDEDDDDDDDDEVVFKDEDDDDDEDDEVIFKDDDDETSFGDDHDEDIKEVTAKFANSLTVSDNSSRCSRPAPTKIFGSTEELPVNFFVSEENIDKKTKPTNKLVLGSDSEDSREEAVSSKENKSTLKSTTKENKPQTCEKTSEKDVLHKILNLLNTGDAAKLADKLNTVGKKRAEQIISYRKQNGLFKTIHELKNIEGIGEKWVSNLITKNKDI